VCWTHCKDEAELHLPEHNKSHNSRKRCAENQQNCMKTLCICRTAFSEDCLKTDCGTTVLWRELGGGGLEGICAPAVLKQYLSHYCEF
jgi:hypothetical protein